MNTHPIIPIADDIAKQLEGSLREFDMAPAQLVYWGLATSYKLDRKPLNEVAGDNMLDSVDTLRLGLIGAEVRKAIKRLWDERRLSPEHALRAIICHRRDIDKAREADARLLAYAHG